MARAAPRVPRWCRCDRADRRRVSRSFGDRRGRIYSPTSARCRGGTGPGREGKTMAVRIDRPSTTPRTARVSSRAGSVAAGAGGSRRRARVSELALGVVVVAVCALGVVLWQRSTTSTEGVLVLARSLRAGEALGADDLRVE